MSGAESREPEEAGLWGGLAGSSRSGSASGQLLMIWPVVAA